MPNIAITGYGPIGSLSTAPLSTSTPIPTDASSNPYQLSPSAANLLGPEAASAANNLYSNPNVSPKDASLAVNDLFGAAQGAATDTAQSTAEGIVAQGDTAEANQYLAASTIADQNARLARASAGIQQAQENRTAMQALGSQAADIAGAGFGGGGTTSMFLYADSAYQSSLANQLIGVQGEINAEGYQQQSLAAQAEASAAQAAAGAAGVLGAQDTATAADLQTNALNTAAFLANNADTTGVGFGQTGQVGNPGGFGGFSVSDPTNQQPTAAQQAATARANAQAAASDAAFNNQIQSGTYQEGPAVSDTKGGALITPSPNQPDTSGLLTAPGGIAGPPVTAPSGAAGDVSGVQETPLAAGDGSA